MKKIPLLVLFLSIISCKDKTDKHVIRDSVDKLQENPQILAGKITDRPTRKFGILVQVLDSLGYSSDTSRVKKLKNYKELLNSEIQLFGKFPFYKIDKEKAKVLWWNTAFNDKENSIDTEIFRTAESVWGFFYQKEEGENLKTDGVIEQWKFTDSLTAQTAMDKLNKRYPLPYFNTQPYYITDGQFLFIFQTRASAFSYRQKDFVDTFRKICSAPKSSYKSLPGLD